VSHESGPGSLVGKAIGYRLDGPGSNQASNNVDLGAPCLVPHATAAPQTLSDLLTYLVTP